MGAMAADGGRPIEVLRADGGACVSDFLMQFQADLLGIAVVRPEMVETTAMGAAFLAGLAAGIWTSTQEIEKIRRVQRVFLPGPTGAPPMPPGAGRSGAPWHGKAGLMGGMLTP